MFLVLFSSSSILYNKIITVPSKIKLSLVPSFLSIAALGLLKFLFAFEKLFLRLYTCFITKVSII